MKALFLTLLSGIGIVAQNPIQEFSGSISSNEDGVSTRRYYRCNPTFSINQTAAGSGLTWDFNGISSLGEKTYTNSEYTSSPYPMPGSTMTTLATPYNSPIVLERYYSSSNETGTAITGYSDEFLTLSYSGESCFVGQFPIEFEDSESNPISGDFWYNGNSETFSGTFSGTSSSTVDSFGTLETDLEGPEAVAVTRLRIIQNSDITINLDSNTHNGTLVQTMYRYYREGDFWPYISWARYVVSCPSLNINQTVTKLEKAFQALLSDAFVAKRDAFQIAPNPVSDQLFLQGSDRANLSISIFDLSGRVILTQNAIGSGIDVAQLSPGTYIAKLTDGTHKATQKFIKK